MIRAAVAMLAVLGGALAAGAAETIAGKTIVGSWATPGKCGRPLSTIVVEPMGLSGEDFYCDFDAVSRSGDTIRWRGTCTFGIDEEKTAVTARLSRGKLSYRINRDGWNGPLQRCPK